jgi:hypothetical protein
MIVRKGRSGGGGSSKGGGGGSYGGGYGRARKDGRDDEESADSPTRESRCLEYITSAREKLAAKDYKAAHNYAVKASLANNLERRAHTEEVDKLTGELSLAAEEMRLVADDKKALGELREALAEYERVYKTFSSLDAGKLAKKQYLELQGTLSSGVLAKEAFVELLRMVQREWKRANGAVIRGAPAPTVDAAATIARMDTEDRAEALRQIFLIIRHHGSTPYGRQALKLLHKLKTVHKVDPDAVDALASL